MRRFKVHLRGENVLLDLDGEHGKFGFKVIRVVRARTAEDAKRRATIQLHQELNQSPNLVKDTPDVPRVFSEKVEELKFYQFVAKRYLSEFVFYFEDLQPA